MATYGYLRVSTEGRSQTTDNQRKQILDSDIKVEEFFSEDGVSGSTKAMDRPAFKRMLAKMQPNDAVVVTMVDRFGRSASDILNVIEYLKLKGIRVRVLQFDGMDITSSMGKMVLTCMAAMAELERNILIERTIAGIERTRAQGTKFGAPLTIKPEVLQEIITKKQLGFTYDKLATEYGIPRNTIARNVSRWSGSVDMYVQEWEVRQQQYSRRAV